MRVGIHVPVSGGLVKAGKRARSLGCECLQIFPRNVRGWRARRYAESEIAAFREILSGRDISPLVVHSCYLVNLASPDRALRERSLRSVADDMKRAALLGGRCVVFHFGHHMGAGTRRGLRFIASGVRSLLSEAPPGIDILLENSAGRGTEMGGEWSEFADLFDLLDGEERVGVCFDTCHAHAAGCRLDGPRRVGRALREFDSVVGLSRLRLLHLNDCRAPAGAHVDHHEHIGRGTIGDAGFRALLRRREMRHRCAILETPIDRPGDDRRNLRRVRKLQA
ncbi:MAG TPA: deoxyribonuclease IV [Armatimonadota bacterium]|nr:deoxyribonuclease IV [Armatimonadota bacterium]